MSQKKFYVCYVCQQALRFLSKKNMLLVHQKYILKSNLITGVSKKDVICILSIESKTQCVPQKVEMKIFNEVHKASLTYMNTFIPKRISSKKNMCRKLTLFTLLKAILTIHYNIPFCHEKSLRCHAKSFKAHLNKSILVV